MTCYSLIGQRKGQMYYTDNKKKYMMVPSQTF